MNTTQEAEAVEAGRRWAEEKADAREGTRAEDWPVEWDPAWAGELHVTGKRADGPMLVALVDRANREAAARWLEIVEARREEQDTRAEGEELEAGAVKLYETLRRHTPEGLSLGREGARVFLQDVEDASEVSVSSIVEALRAIDEWQGRHVGH